jgi:hypothetical protein
VLESAAERDSNATCLWSMSNLVHCDVSVHISLNLQYHRRLFIINQKLAHMNEQNFMNLGAWWAQKMSRAQEKLTAAVEVFVSLDLEEPYLRNQWHAQHHAMTRANPGVFVLCNCLNVKVTGNLRSLKGSCKLTYQ